MFEITGSPQHVRMHVDRVLTVDSQMLRVVESCPRGSGARLDPLRRIVLAKQSHLLIFLRFCRLFPSDQVEAHTRQCTNHCCQSACITLLCLDITLRSLRTIFGRSSTYQFSHAAEYFHRDSEDNAEASQCDTNIPYR